MADKTTQIEVFPFDKIVTVEISGGFYARISELLLHHTGGKDMKDLAKVIAELKDREPENDFEYHLITLLTLIGSIEKSAKDQDLLVFKEVPTKQ